jgi:phospholipid/cholesterol/gamma-HCH transport system substrate-binding protein
LIKKNACVTILSIFLYFIMKKNTQRLEGFVGVAILLVAILGLFYAFQGRHSYFNPKTEYSAEFDSVQGIEVGTPVKIQGVDVGKVLDIQLYPKKGVVHVRFSIPRDLSLFSDVKVSIVGESFLGKKIVAVDPGAKKEILDPKKTIYHTTCADGSLESLIERFLFSKK